LTRRGAVDIAVSSARLGGCCVRIRGQRRKHNERKTALHRRSFVGVGIVDGMCVVVRSELSVPGAGRLRTGSTLLLPRASRCRSGGVPTDYRLCLAKLAGASRCGLPLPLIA